MEVKRKRLVLKTLSRNPLEDELRAKKGVVRVRVHLKRSYMRRPEDVKHPTNN